MVLSLFPRSFIPRLLVLLMNCQNQEMEKSWKGYALFESENSSYVFGQPRSYQCYTETYQNSCKEAPGHQEIILTSFDATSIASCKDVIQAFRDNEKIFVGLFRHAEDVYRESIPMPRIVNWQTNRANPLAVLLLQLFRSSVFLLFIDTVLE